MTSNCNIVKVPLRRDNKNLKEVAKLEVISSQDTLSGPKTLREVMNKLVKETGSVYVAKVKGQIVGCITYKKNNILSMDSFYIADAYKGNGVSHAIRVRAIEDANKKIRVQY